MPLPLKSKQQIDIKAYYAVNVLSLWRGLRKEHLSFWFLCLYFLFEYVRPQVLYPSIDILRWSFLFLILAAIAAISDKSVSWTSTPLNKWLIVFAIVVVLSGVFAYYPARSWDERNTMLTWVIDFFLVITIVNTEKRLILFLLAFMLYNLKMSQHGVHDWVSRGFSFASYGLIGSPGWFHNSGEFAIEMLVFGSLAIAFVVAFRQYWGKYKKWLLYAAASTGYISVIGASSRGAQLALAVIVAWGLLKIRGGFKFLFYVIVLSIALYHLLPEKQIQRFQNSGDDQTSLQRLAYWKIGIEISKEHPVLGVGYMNWLPYVKRRYPEGVGPLDEIQVPHSIYILAVAELGYIGLFLFVLMILVAFYMNAQTRKLAKNAGLSHIWVLSYGLDAGLIGYLVAGAFVTVLYYPFFWIQIALMAMLHNVAKNTQRRVSDSSLSQSSDVNESVK